MTTQWNYELLKFAQKNTVGAIVIGKEPSPDTTLLAVVKRCFSDLENDFALGGKPGSKVALECMDNGDWVKFAE